MARVVPLLTHLPPPAGTATSAWIGSVRISSTPSELGFADVKPFPAYKHIYRLPDVRGREPRLAISRFDYTGTARRRRLHRVRFSRAGQMEADPADQSDLFSVDAGEQLVIVDLRPVSRRPLTLLGGSNACSIASATPHAISHSSRTSPLPRMVGTASPTRSRNARAARRARPPSAGRVALSRPGDSSPRVHAAAGHASADFCETRPEVRFANRKRLWIVPMATTSEAQTRRRATDRIASVPQTGGLQFSVDAQGRLVIQASGPSHTGRRGDGKEDKKKKRKRKRRK